VSVAERWSFKRKPGVTLISRSARQDTNKWERISSCFVQDVYIRSSNSFVFVQNEP